MKNIKLKQLNSEVHYKISEIILGLDNISASCATITEVVLNGDNSNAKIYVTFLKGNKEKSFNELKKAIPFIRRELAHSLNIKKTPVLEFILDEKLDEINKMEELIKKANE